MIALLVIDVQKEYSATGALPVERFDETVKNVRALLDAARSNEKSVVVHVRHISRTPGDSSFDAGSPGLDFIDEVRPLAEEFVLTKHYPSAFTNPELDRFLLRHGAKSVVICGLTSFICCESTSREASALGYNVYYVDDAISEFALGRFSAQELHNMVSAVQGAMFSKVASTAEAISLFA